MEKVWPLASSVEPFLRRTLTRPLMTLTRLPSSKLSMRNAGVAVGFDAEVAAGDAEIVAIAGIDREGCGALAQNQARGLGAVFEREIEELENGVFADQRERAVFKFDFGAAVAGGDDEALANGEIELGVLPHNVFFAGERVAFDVAGETHFALDIADANNSDVTDVGRSGRSAGKSSDKEECEKTDENKMRNEECGKTCVTPYRGHCYL